MSTKPFLKWAGGKRWLVDREDFVIPAYEGRYIEPFLGGGAVFFHHSPERAILSDLNPRLIETYQAIKDDWETVWKLLETHQKSHSKEYYYEVRAETPAVPTERAAHFLYLNRACWNGLYRENLRGEFNVPIGTKSKIIMDNDDFHAISQALQKAELKSCDFQKTIHVAESGDFVFIDPPYTIAHNLNGFVKYNQNIFSWDDQVRLRDACVAAQRRGAFVVVSNADHESVRNLYKNDFQIQAVSRHAVISGLQKGRRKTTEIIIHGRR